MKKIICILSGGLDSATMLYEVRNHFDVVETVTFNYGQRHKKEILSAQSIAQLLAIPHRVIDIQNFQELLAGSSLTSATVATPEGHYREETMKQTIVPNRNAIMINIAAGYAISKKITHLALGVHAGDHFIYPDCRPEFIKSQAKTLSLANDCDFTLVAPFLKVDKVAIVKRAKALGVPFELTWTCYEGGRKPCGKCGSCIERIEAFLANDLVDPLYDRQDWLEAVKHAQTLL